MSDTEYCITQLTVENDNTEDVPLYQYEYIVSNNLDGVIIITNN